MRRLVLRNKMICLLLESCNDELAKDPNNIAILKTRAIALSIARKYIEAIEDLIKVINASPDDVTSYYMKSDCYFQLGEFEKAKEDYFRAVLLEDNPNIEKKYIENVTVPEETELSDIEKILDYEWNKAVSESFPEIINGEHNH
jgi:tetratricopeptide (TPR) repeat protein